jgi:hypothetical protein
MKINTEFDLGEEVYISTDLDQYRRIITGIEISPGGIQYRLSVGMEFSWHYDVEISRDRDIMILTSN